MEYNQEEEKQDSGGSWCAWQSLLPVVILALAGAICIVAFLSASIH